MTMQHTMRAAKAPAKRALLYLGLGLVVMLGLAWWTTDGFTKFITWQDVVLSVKTGVPIEQKGVY